MKFLAPVVLSASAAIAAVSPPASDSSVRATCNDDDTITIAIDYNRKADIIGFEYGTCTNVTEVRGADSQDGDNNWELTLDVTACGMGSELRTLDYVQKASIRVGKKVGDTELTFANFDVDSYCSYTSEYKVKFDYGELETDHAQFNNSGGLIGLEMKIRSYNSSYEAELDAPTQGGKTIYLGLTIENSGFDHADNQTHLTNATSGKVFVPRKCQVQETSTNATYTMFDASQECFNRDIDLTVDYIADQHMWTIEHTLFLLGNERKSSYELICDVTVCDAARSDVCDAFIKKCLE